MSGLRARPWPWAPALLSVTLLIACFACSGGAPPQAARHAIVVGVDLPLGGDSGDRATAALDQVRAVLSAGYRGSIEGLPVVLHALDDAPGGRRDPVQAERNLRSLAADPAVLGVIGPLDSDIAEEEIPVASAAHLALVSPGAAAACLTRPLAACDGLAARLRGAGPVSFFRVVPSDDLEPAALVQFAVGSLHATRFAVASDGQAYGAAARDGFDAALRASGHPSVFHSDFDPHSSSAVATFVAGAKSAGADAVFFGGRGDGGACLLAGQVSEVVGATVPLLGDSGLLGAGCVADAAASAGDVYAAGPLPEAPAEVAARALFAALATAIKTEGGNIPSREEVRAALARQSLFDRDGDLRSAELPIYRGQPPGPAQTTAPWAVAGSVPVSRS